MKTVNCPEVCSNVTSRISTIRRLRAMVAKLASDSGLPCSPAGNAANKSAAMIAASAANAAKAKRQPKCVAKSVTTGRPPAIASDQPRKTKAMARPRSAGDTSSEAAEAACAV